MAEISYQQLVQNVRAKTPLLSQTSVTSTFGAPTVEIPQVEPFYIKITGFKPSDTITSTNRTEDEAYTLLSVDKSKNTNNYKGRQILINSSRIVLNSYDNYTMLFSKEGFVFSSKGTFNVDTDEEITLFGNEGLFLGVPNKGLPYENNPKPPNTQQPDDSITDNIDNEQKPYVEGQGNITNPVTINNLTEDTGNTLTYQEEVQQELSNKINDRNVATPDRDYEPLILGNKLADWLSDLILVIQTLEISTPSGQGFVSSGDSQYNLKKLVARIPEMVSTYAYIDGRSHLPVDDPGGSGLGEPTTTQPPNNNTLASNDNALITNSDGLAGPLGDIPQYTLQQLQARAQQLGYGPIDTTFSLVGIRSNADAYDRFDDMLILIVNSQLKYFKGTTNPGGKVLSGGFREYNNTGAAVLRPGQYTSHAQGKHNGQYLAGRQTAANVTVLRDGNLDKLAGNVPETTATTGKFGINLHKANASGVSRTVDSWSAGCQVFADATNFNEFMSQWTASGKKIVQYTLFQQF